MHFRDRSSDVPAPTLAFVAKHSLVDADAHHPLVAEGLVGVDLTRR
jgi:hypothetical protein